MGKKYRGNIIERTNGRIMEEKPRLGAVPEGGIGETKINLLVYPR